jgi:hypothetical protein
MKGRIGHHFSKPPARLCRGPRFPSELAQDHVSFGTSAMASDWFVSAGDGIELAQTQMKQNRDGHQDARQDCQNAGGAVGGDKRGCKQDT